MLGNPTRPPYKADISSRWAVAGLQSCPKRMLRWVVICCWIPDHHTFRSFWKSPLPCFSTMNTDRAALEPTPIDSYAIITLKMSQECWFWWQSWFAVFYSENGVLQRPGLHANSAKIPTCWTNSQIFSHQLQTLINYSSWEGLQKCHWELDSIMPGSWVIFIFVITEGGAEKI